jgi:hypothetical protein
MCWRLTCPTNGGSAKLVALLAEGKRAQPPQPGLML